jgi:phage terminase small subunit
MPRKSRAALDLASHVNAASNRLRPPDDLPADVVAVFRRIVASTDPRHFVPADLDLLVRYCKAIADAALADRMLATDGYVIDGKPSAWIAIQREANRAIAVLATRLRLSPQSRVDPKTTGARMPHAAPSVYGLLGLDEEELRRD